MSWIDVGRTFNEHGEPLVVSDGPISLTVERMEEILAAYRATIPTKCACADSKMSYADWVRNYQKARRHGAI